MFFRGGVCVRVPADGCPFKQIKCWSVATPIYSDIVHAFKLQGRSSFNRDHMAYEPDVFTSWSLRTLRQGGLLPGSECFSS